MECLNYDQAGVQTCLEKLYIDGVPLPFRYRRCHVNIEDHTSGRHLPLPYFSSVEQLT